MKRLLLTVFMAISGLLLSGFAAQAGTPLTQGGFSYEILPDNTASILKCVDNCSATDLVIPATLGEVPVTKIADSAFLGDATNSLKGSLIIPSSILEIGPKAFAYNAITSVSFPTTFVKIGASAFSHNQLADLSVPTWMSVVPDEAFSYNPLTSLTIPEGVTAIGLKSFYNSTVKLNILFLPKSLKKLGDRALGVKTRQISYNQNFITVVFSGKAPTFANPNYRFISDVNPDVEDQDVYMLYDYANKASWKKFDFGEGCRKSCFATMSLWVRPDLLRTTPVKPTAVWARLNIQGVFPKFIDRNVYVVQLSGNIGAAYFRATKPNVFKQDDPSSSYTFAVPPPGFAKINLKADPERIYSDATYDYFEYPDNKSPWSYYEFKPFRGWVPGLPDIEGEHLIGTITLEERQKMKRYYCVWTPPKYQELTCTLTPTKVVRPGGGSGGGSGGN